MSELIQYKVIADAAELEQVVLLQEITWGVGSVTTQPQLIAAIHHGGIILGAFRQKKLVGFCYGFPGFVNKRNFLVSQMMAIDPDYRNEGIGYQLKILQKEWAKEYGYEKIIWTFDPLESRDAYLNLHKLGAYSRKYYPSYYGEMSYDLINQGMPSDRFLIEWDISPMKDEQNIREGVFEFSKIEKLLDVDVDDSRPVQRVPNLIEPYYLIAVPTTIHQMKKENISLAKEWRYTLRDVLTELFTHDYAVIDLVKGSGQHNAAYYVIKKIG